MILPVILFVILNTTGLLLLKTSLSPGLNISLETIKTLIANWRFGFGFIAYALSFLTWLYILSKKDIVYAYPLVIGLSYALIVLAAVIFLKETLTLYKVIGITLIGLGLIFITS